MRFVPAKQLFDEADAQANALLVAAGDGHSLSALHELIQKNPASPIQIALLIRKIKSMERVISTKKAASSKNADARNWVQAKWLAHGDAAKTKKKFAEEHIELVKKKFKNGKGGELEITFKTIYTEWLKGL